MAIHITFYETITHGIHKNESKQIVSSGLKTIPLCVKVLQESASIVKQFIQFALNL